MPMPSRAFSSSGFHGPRRDPVQAFQDHSAVLGSSLGLCPAAGLGRTSLRPRSRADRVQDAVQEQELRSIQEPGLGQLRPSSRPGTGAGLLGRPNSRPGTGAGPVQEQGLGRLRPGSRASTAAGLPSQEQGLGATRPKKASNGSIGQDPFLHEKLDDRLRVEDADVDHLDWTTEPSIQVIKEGNTRCFIAEPPDGKGPRQHLPFLVRELDLQPAPALRRAFEGTEAQSGVKPAELTVKERDLRRCGSDLTLLSKCALPKVQPTIEPLLPSRVDKNIQFRMKRSRSSAGPLTGSQHLHAAFGATSKALAGNPGPEAIPGEDASKCREPDAAPAERRDAPSERRGGSSRPNVAQPSDAAKAGKPEAQRTSPKGDSIWAKLQVLQSGIGPSHILHPEEPTDAALLGGGPASVVTSRASASPRATYFSQRALRLAAALPASPSAGLLKAAAYAAEAKLPPPLLELNRGSGGVINPLRMALPGQAF